MESSWCSICLEWCTVTRGRRTDRTVVVVMLVRIASMVQEGVPHTAENPERGEVVVVLEEVTRFEGGSGVALKGALPEVKRAVWVLVRGRC